MNRPNLVGKPDFLIIGAAKSGTTSLYAYLRQHPEVFMPGMKELNYFAPTHPFGIHDFSEYSQALTPDKSAQVVGEASPAYLSSPESPNLIHEALGDRVKLIALLRNPADMMYSHWAHSVRDALESRQAETALLQSFNESWKPAEWYLQYAERAQYAKQLKRYYDLFPTENIKIYLYEDFFTPNFFLFNDLCSFLGVSSFAPDTEKKHNKGFLPKYRWLHRFINVHYGRHCLPLARRIVPTEVRHWVRGRLDVWNGIGRNSVPPMSRELRQELERQLDAGVRDLEKMLDRNLRAVWF